MASRANKTEQRATQSTRPIEFIEKEEQEVRRLSSVNPRAASFAAQHRRYSTMEESGRSASYDAAMNAEKGSYDENGNHKEEV